MPAGRASDALALTQVLDAGMPTAEITMRIRGALLACLCLLGSGPVDAAGPAQPAVPRFEPAPCAFLDVAADWASQQRIACGWLHVHESRGKTDSRTLKLWIAIARADVPDSNDAPFLYLNGGPGYATVDYFFPYFPQSKTLPALRKTRDLVFLDQRGTGRSQPAFCPQLKRDLEALSQQAPAARAALQRTIAAYAACRPRILAEGFDFAAYNSTTTVEDAEDLRRALGVRQWNLYGISYGTLVGLEYLRRHPISVRSAILDSPYPPNSPHGAEQITSTALAFQALQRSCDREAACHARFPDMLGRLQVARKRLDAAPLLQAEGGRITGGRLLSSIWTMLVQSSVVRWVPLAIEHAANGDDETVRRIVALYGGSGSFGDYRCGLAQTVNCFEGGVGDTTPAVRAAMLRYPYLVETDALPEANARECAAWQSEHAPPAFFAPVHSDVPSLLYGGEFDPATPYDDAVRAGRHLRNSTLVQVRGASHAGMGRDDCTRSIAHAFLRNPQAKPDLACLTMRDVPAIAIDGLEHLDSLKP